MDDAPYAIRVKGDFRFDSVIPPDQGAGSERMNVKKKEPKSTEGKAKGSSGLISKLLRRKQGAGDTASGDMEAEKSAEDEEGVPFALKDIDLKIPRGTSFLSQRLYLS